MDRLLRDLHTPTPEVVVTVPHRRPRTALRPWRFQGRSNNWLFGGLAAATALTLSALTGIPQTAHAATAPPDHPDRLVFDLDPAGDDF
ncbi:hypothetical protein ABZZ16_41345, partial [Streptomyces sp. NPDC006386]